MSSIIEGYNYDIFISYRQKDNKYIKDSSYYKSRNRIWPVMYSSAIPA
jgi:hypothetical protein